MNKTLSFQNTILNKNRKKYQLKNNLKSNKNNLFNKNNLCNNKKSQNNRKIN